MTESTDGPTVAERICAVLGAQVGAAPADVAAALLELLTPPAGPVEPAPAVPALFWQML